MKKAVILKPKTPKQSKYIQDDLVKDLKVAMGIPDRFELLNSQNGMVIDDTNLTYDLIPFLIEADLIVVDAFCYETEGNFKQSPYLYYLIGVCHAFGDKTILVFEDTHPLPTTFYDRSIRHNPNLHEFEPLFREKVEKMLNIAPNSPAGNPVQKYMKSKEFAQVIEEAEQKQREIEALEAKKMKGIVRLNKANKQNQQRPIVFKKLS